jgi:hypothetical protein
VDGTVFEVTMPEPGVLGMAVLGVAMVKADALETGKDMLEADNGIWASNSL